MSDPVLEYQRRYDSFLQTIAKNLEDSLQEYLSEVLRIDRISARAKAPERFAEKAGRKNDEGLPKYKAPLTEIQDQIGARVVVFYKEDVEPVVEKVGQYFRHIENKEIVPESHWEFGYFGHHLILALPKDVIPNEVDLKEVPRFFELQIKTLFQHAWSEANHDFGYKPVNDLTQDQLRRLAFTAAQAWGADKVFQDLWEELIEKPPSQQL